MFEFINSLWQNHSVMLIDITWQGVLAIAVLAGGYFIGNALSRSIYKNREKIDVTLAPLMSGLAKYVVYAICIIIILDVFGINTTSIIAVLGAAGIAVGLALKNTLSNIAAGVMLLMLRPFKVGDSIECGAVTGKIKEVGLFTTIMQTGDGIYASVPNNSLWAAPIKNFTRNGTRRMDLQVGIAYADSIDTGFNVLQSIAEGESRLLRDPAPQIMVQAMGESAVTLQLRAWTTVDDYWNTVWDLNKRIKESIEAAGLTIPFPQRDLHVFNKAG